MRVFELELVPPAPSFPLIGAVSWSRAGASAPLGNTHFREGPSVRLATTVARIDANVTVQDCRTERLTDLGPVTQVRLRAGYEVVLSLPPDLELPGDGVRLCAALRNDPRAWSGVPSAFDERREIHCYASELGTATVQWYLEYGSRNSLSSVGRSRLDMPKEHTVDIRDVEGPQRFVLALTDEELAAALAPR